MVKYDKVVIKKSTNPQKKLMATFSKKDGGKTKTLHFGSAGMSDFPTHRDKERKSKYISRHRPRENWSVPDTSGSLARWILWNKATRSASIADYKRRFNLK